MLVSNQDVSNKFIMIKVGSRNWVGQAACQYLYKIKNGHHRINRVSNA